jgi:hypothetical protein
VFLTNLEGKVGKVGKVGKEGRLREYQLPILYQILQQSNKNCEKINEQFCCGNLVKLHINYQFSSSQIRC